MQTEQSRHRRAGVLLAACMATLAVPLTACKEETPALSINPNETPQTQSGGNIPLGFWVLNRERSTQLQPVNQTLWIVKDNGKFLVWVLVGTDESGMVRVNSWEGPYDGDPVPVNGTSMTTQITSPAPGMLHNFGQIKGVGPYSEDCQVMDSGKRFLCHGEVTTAGGVQQWTDDFDWVSAAP